MIVGAAVCPGAPFLVPGLAPGLAAAAPELLASCARAVATLAGAEHLLLLTSGPPDRNSGRDGNRDAITFPPGTAVTSARLADSRGVRHFAAALIGGRRESDPDTNTGPPPAVGVIVGAALLAASGIGVPTTAVQVGGDSTVPERFCAESKERIGVLLIADGATCRGADSPGGGHPDASAFDRDLSAALADGDPHRLDELVRSGRGTAVGFLAGPAMAAFARLTGDRPPVTAELLYDEAPFGVGYFCATWSWR